MVRGNWQKRVETAEARRVAAKQRKQRRENKGLFKAMVNDFLALLDRHLDALQRAPPWILHVWTDTLPSDSTLSVLYNDVAIKSKRRGRSSSFNEQTKGGRKTKNTGKKKSHPRSHEQNAIQDEAEESAAVPRLCPHHFFTGKCEASQRKSGCRHVHLGKKETLCSILDGNSSSKETLNLSLEAATAAGIDGASDAAADTSGDGMEMVHHVQVNLFAEQEGEDNMSVHDQVQKVLSEKSCSLGSIVYVTMNNFLLFDRYREGLVLSEDEFVETVLGEGKPLRLTDSQGDKKHGINTGVTDNEHPALLLPASILEHILTYLPDRSVPVMCKVCKAWHREIGTTSPSLWKHLLQRQNWPMPVMEESDEGIEDAAETSLNARDVFRNGFIEHYSVVRNVRAIQEAMAALTGPTRKIVEEKEMVFQAFNTRREAPQRPNPCIAVKVWSPRRVLAAYSHDCTLRLFEAVEKPASEIGSGCPRGCREVVCVRASPFKTVKKSCRLVAMDIDDDMIACLCCSLQGSRQSEFFLILISREDFLCAGGTTSDGSFNLDEGSITVIDIERAVQLYLEAELDIDLMQALSEYIGNNGYDAEDLHVRSSYNLVACGYGRFMVEVQISIPTDFVSAEAQNRYEMTDLDRKLVIFSASAGAIVWMGRSNPAAHPVHEDMNLACLQGKCASSGGSTTVAIASSCSPLTWAAEIEPDGHFRLAQTFEATDFMANAIENGWSMSSTFHRPVAITPSHIVVVNNISRPIVENGDGRIRVAVVLMYPHAEGNIASPAGVLRLDGMCEAIRIESVGDEHVVILCRFYVPAMSTEDRRVVECQLQLFAVIIHVPTHREIQRFFLMDEGDGMVDQNHHRDIPMFFSSFGETVGFGVWYEGMVLTGNDVRSVGEDSGTMKDAGEKSSAKKKKKKRQFNKGSKKDGFARGMSLRG